MTPFHDLHDYMALPRLTGLRLAPDGSWLAASVSALSADGRTFKPSIWRIRHRAGAAQAPPCPADPVGRGRGQPGLPAGRLAGVPVRPARPAGRPGRRARLLRSLCRPLAAPPPNAAPGDGPARKRALWLLPADGGEACQLTAPPGGICRLATAAAAPLAAFTCPVLPGASGIADDAQRRKSRADAGRDRDPARGRPGPALGPRPGPGSAPPAGHRRGAPDGRRR